MTLTPRTHYPLTRALFFSFWAVVLITRMFPVDARVLKGNPVQAAPRAPIHRMRSAG